MKERSKVKHLDRKQQEEWMLEDNVEDEGTRRQNEAD